MRRALGVSKNFSFNDIQSNTILLTEDQNYREARIKKRKLRLGESTLRKTHFTEKLNFELNVHNVALLSKKYFEIIFYL